MKKKICVIGGGTGTYTVLSGLKKYSDKLEISAVISMMDSGGSNRILRDEFGLLPTSDIRQCIVALAGNNGNETLRKLFTYRYNHGTGISGMTFGNLFMAALSDIYGGNQEEAIKKTCRMLGVVGEIHPVTYENAHLVARYSNGKQVLGEHYIDEPDMETGRQKIVELEIIPKVKPNKKAIETIKNADLVVLGPGDLFTSIICNLVVEGVSEAVSKTRGKVVYISNLMTKFGQTNDFSVSDHVNEIEKYIGVGNIDICFVNKYDKLPKEIIKKYEEELAVPVLDDLNSKKSKMKIIRKNFLSNVVFDKQKSDKLKRSLIRHDSQKIARELLKNL